MVIRRLSIPRRAVLRGIGATIALPWLDARPQPSRRRPRTQPPKRFGVMYVHANGCLVENLVPVTTGQDFEVTPILKPLEKHRDQLTVVSGLANAQGDPLDAGSGPHSRSAGCWLSGMRARRTEGADLRAGRRLISSPPMHLATRRRCAPWSLGLTRTTFPGAARAATAAPM